MPGTNGLTEEEKQMYGVKPTDRAKDYYEITYFKTIINKTNDKKKIKSFFVLRPDVEDFIRSKEKPQPPKPSKKSKKVEMGEYIDLGLFDK